jgi:hypothetical protein
MNITESLSLEPETTEDTGAVNDIYRIVIIT